MKKLLPIGLIALAFTQPKPPTFLQRWQSFDQALYDYVVAKYNSGDTITTKSAMLTAAGDLSAYNVPQELAKIPIVQQACRWGCTGQFYYYCINLAANSQEALACMNEYINCTRTCGYIPF